MIQRAVCAMCAKMFHTREPEPPLVCGQCLDYLGSQPGSGVPFSGMEIE